MVTGMLIILATGIKFKRDVSIFRKKLTKFILTCFLIL